MQLKSFSESFKSDKTLKDYFPTDLAYLNRQDIIDIISNTFDTEVVSSDPKWTILKSKWHVIDKEDELTKLRMDEYIDEQADVYFFIQPDDFLIVRGNKDNEKLTNFIDDVKSIDSRIKTTSTGHDSGSLILKGRKFYNIFFAFAEIPKGESSIDKDGDYFSLQNMGCSGDVRLDGKTIAYYADLMIGIHVEMDVERKKKHPGLNMYQAWQKDMEERTKPTLEPKVYNIKHSGIFQGSPSWNDYNKNLVTFSQDKLVFEILDGIEKKNDGEFYFPKPKNFEKMKFSIHSYSSADVYYVLRISEIETESGKSFVFNWFAKLFATEEHLKSYYKKYPHFAPGGDRHTFTDSKGNQVLNYQPPMFKDVQRSLFGYSSADTIGETYYCESVEALVTLLTQFNDFMEDNSQSHFTTAYPKFKK